MPNNTVPAADAGLPNRRLFLAAGSAGAVLAAVSGCRRVRSRAGGLA